jgi:hypothetical protein
MEDFRWKIEKILFSKLHLFFIKSKIPQSLPAGPGPDRGRGRQAHSAMHHVGCMAALNLTWFRAHRPFT